MTMQGFGYAVVDYGSVWQLDRKLQILVEAGYTHAEIKPDNWQIWEGDRVQAAQLARFTAVLGKYHPHLQYIMQLPEAVNLFDLAHKEMQERRLQQALEVGETIGARIMLYKAGQRVQATDTHFVAMSELMARERDVLAKAADRAATWGSQIAIETSSHITTKGHTYAVWPELLTQQVKILNHPAVGVCLDASHLYIAANWYGFNYLESVTALAPYTTHFHVQDALGVMDYPATSGPSLAHSVTYLPPGWNRLPFHQIIRQIQFATPPVLMLELGEQFFPHIQYFLRESQRLFGFSKFPKIV